MRGALRVESGHLKRAASKNNPDSPELYTTKTHELLAVEPNDADQKVRLNMTSFCSVKHDKFALTLDAVSCMNSVDTVAVEQAAED